MIATTSSGGSWRRRRTARWLSSCATGLALAAAPQVARAQAFQGTPTTVEGSTIITTPTATTTNIVLRTSETVIDWVPFDVGGTGNIDYLPAGSTATFSDGGLAGYTVLNRILPQDVSGFPVSRVVELNGTINSTLGGVPGGNVWFYTPTGFLVGANAVMQVGGLVLTTDDIVFSPTNTGGTTLFAPGNTVLFRGPAGVASSVVIQPGAQITANGVNSYVAMVSPLVNQGGTVRANRSIGYVGAEQANISINAGLFNISILAGTTDANGVIHTGTSTGAASTASADIKRVSIVAMPKATALTMMLSGSIGYTAAASAANDGSAVILSSGFDSGFPTTQTASTLGNIAIDNANFSNPTAAFASNRIDITAVGGNSAFGSSSSLYAQQAIGICFCTGGNLVVGGDLALLTSHDNAGGTIDIALGNKANLVVNGQFFANASSNGTAIGLTPPPDATGGTVSISADGGSLSAQGITLSALAVGENDPTQGGNATGGTIKVDLTNGGSINSNSLNAFASATGGSSKGPGGNAVGGTISLSSTSSILSPGDLFVVSNANGGASSVLSGSGTGGHIGIDLSGGTYTWTSLAAVANAYSDYSTGGQGNNATALADAIDLNLTNAAALTLTDDTTINASAYASIDGGGGITSTGGGINIRVLGGSSLDFTYLQAQALAGVNLAEPGIGPSVAADTTPDTIGGAIHLFVDSGSATGQYLALDSSASGLGAATGAGSATGGTAAVVLSNAGQLSLDDGSGGAYLSITANGLGSAGTSAANASGGAVELSNDDSSVSVAGSITLSAAGKAFNYGALYLTGPLPLTGFDASGGSADVVVSGTALTPATLSATDLTTDASGNATRPTFFYAGGGPPAGTYGGPLFGDVGDGAGGSSDFTASGTNTVTVGSLVMSTDGYGGIAAPSDGTPFANGNGTGGTTSFSSLGGSQTFTLLSLGANGVGGSGPGADVSMFGSFAGDGIGGNATVTVGAGALTANTTSIDAAGLGGTGADHFGSGTATDGGAGQGGTAGLVFDPAATGSFTTNGLDLDAEGFGGDGGVSASGPGGNGGGGTGGTAEAHLDAGAFSLGPVRVLAEGFGGDGSGTGIAGEGHGGFATFSLIDTAAPTGARSLDSLDLYADGTGGIGSAGTADGDAGSVTFAAQAQDSSSGLTVNGPFLALSRGTRAAAGDGFTASISGAPLTIGGLIGINTARDAAITATQPMMATGPLSITARSLIQSGTIGATGNVGVTAPQFINAAKIASGGTTTLIADSGPITVTDLTSTGDVTAQAQSIDVVGSGALNLAFVRATAGNLAFSTTGNLGVQFASSTGAMTLDSTAGAVTATGPVAAGGDFNSSGRDGASFGTLISGGTTALASAGGAIQVTDLTSPGEVTANGGSVNIASTAGLTFGASSATAGDLSLSALSITANAPLSAAGNTSITGTNGISLTSLTSGGTTLLSAPSGPLLVVDLRSGGPVSASAQSIDITGGAALSFAPVSATAGDLSIETAGNLDLATVDATGAVTLASTGGAIHNTGAVNGSGIAYTAAGNVTSDAAITSSGGLTVNAGGVLAATSLNATGAVGVTATGGLGASSIASGGTTLLQAAGGTIDVGNLSSVGQVTTLARGITINSTSALSFANAQATAGDLRVISSGNLAFDAASASGALGLNSNGGTLIATGPVSAGGAVNVAGTNGLTFGTLGSGGTTLLGSANGAILVGALSSTGAVTAVGRSVDITSPGALAFSSASATAGPLSIATVGNLVLPQANVTGAMTLSSTNGSVASATNLTAGGAVGINAVAGITLNQLNSGATTSLTSDNGPISITRLASAGPITALGRSIAIGSGEFLNFASVQATGGDVALQAATNLTLGTTSATGAVSLTSDTGSVSATGPVISGGNLAVSGDTGIDLVSATSGGTVSLTAANGAVGAASLTAGGPVTASGRSLDIASPGALSFADAQATAGNIAIQTAGNLLIAKAGATGNLDLASTGGTLSDGGTAPAGSASLTAGGAIALSGNGGVSFASLSSGGTTSLASANGNVAVGDVQSGGAVTASGRGVSLGSTGALTVANATATGGDIAVSTAGNLTVGGATATGGVNLASTAGNLRTTGAIAGNTIGLAGGGITADAGVTSAGTLTIDARGTLTLNATATGSSIDARAADIAIAAGGQLGTRGRTLDLTLTNRNAASTTTIGDAGTTGAFALSNAEAGRLFADQSITLAVAPSTLATGDLTIGALTMSFGATGNIGSGGVLKVNTIGRVAVTGAVALATTGNDDTFSIDPSRIDVIAGAGSIVMANAAGTPTGRLGLDAGTIAVADQPTLNAIATAPTFAAINSALDTPGAAGPAGGYLQAGSIELNAVDALYIQNSGASSAYADRRGFTADSLFITTGTPDTRISINGVLGSATGLDTVASVFINDVPAAAGGRFDPLSSVNGCVIGANCLIVTPEFTDEFGSPTGDELEQPLPDGTITGGPFVGPLVQLEDTNPLVTPPLVDEPITGVGNDDLWQVRCESPDATCPAKEDGE